jgi:hypothetical protein
MEDWRCYQSKRKYNTSDITDSSEWLADHGLSERKKSKTHLTN